MGIFGKKEPTEFDASQDKAIQQMWQWIEKLNKNQQVLIKNNNRFIEQIAALEKAVQALINKDREHDATDQKLQSILDALSKVSETAAE